MLILFSRALVGAVALGALAFGVQAPASPSASAGHVHRVWLGALGRDAHGKEGRHRRIRRRLRRANRGLPPLCEGRREIVSLRTFIEDGGARLKQLLSRLHAGGMTTFRFPRVHPAEIAEELLETLGFRPARRHRLYAAKPQSA